MLSNNMLPVEAKCITSYGLHDALANTPDGSVNENFISHIGNRRCVDFEKLCCGNDKCFGVCLFKTIYQLIRTSEGYDENNKEAKKQAIKNVLEGEEGEKKIYQWFRDGLKTFFNKAKEKNQNINIENVLEDVKELDELLKSCEIDLIVNNDNELTVQEKEKKKENGYNINNEIKYNEEDNNTIISEKEKEKEEGGQKSKFPRWAKILLGFVGILIVAALALLFGLGVIGALAGAAKTAALIIDAVTLFAGLTYLYLACRYLRKFKNKPGSDVSGSSRRFNLYRNELKILYRDNNSISPGNNEQNKQNELE